MEGKGWRQVEHNCIAAQQQPRPGLQGALELKQLCRVVLIWARMPGPLCQAGCPEKTRDLRRPALCARAPVQRFTVNYCLHAPPQPCELGFLCPRYRGETEK